MYTIGLKNTDVQGALVGKELPLEVSVYIMRMYKLVYYNSV